MIDPTTHGTENKKKLERETETDRQTDRPRNGDKKQTRT